MCVKLITYICSMKEIWKDIEGYIGLYQVSNIGRVKSLPREWVSGYGTIRKHNGVILKLCTNQKGYLCVGLTKNGKVKSFRTHRLVANVFIPNPYNKPQVNHINGIKTDNTVENLEWNTSKENINHAIDTKLRCDNGSLNTNSKLTEQQVLDIRASNETGVTLSLLYGISTSQISLIKRRERWTHI